MYPVFTEKHLKIQGCIYKYKNKTNPTSELHHASTSTLNYRHISRQAPMQSEQYILLTRKSRIETFYFCMNLLSNYDDPLVVTDGYGWPGRQWNYSVQTNTKGNNQFDIVEKMGKAMDNISMKLFFYLSFRRETGCL